MGIVAFAVLAGALIVCAPANAASPATSSPIASASTPPFPAPITSRTAIVPAAVTSGSAFNQWLSDVPDGSIVEFPSNASIDLDTGFGIAGRNNLVLHLNGATLRVQGPGSVPDSSPFFVRESNHIEIDGPATVIGNNPNTTTLFTSGNENSHILALSGWGGQGPSSYIEIRGIDARNIYGDFAYLEGRNVAPYDPSSFVWIHDNTGTALGRNAVSSIDVTDLLVEHNSFDRIGLDAWDIEPNFDGQQVRRNVFRSNHIGAYSLMTQLDGWLLSTSNKTNAVIEDITLTDNDVVGVSASGHSGIPRGLQVQIDHSGRPRQITVTNNRTAQAAPGPVMRFIDVDGLTVDGNVQPLTSGELTSLGQPLGPLRTLAYLVGLFIVLAVAGLLARRFLSRRRAVMSR
jgi:hypothetical protein